MKSLRAFIALLLCCVLLTGCAGLGKPDLAEMGLTAYSDMIYSRPDMDKLEQSLNTALEAAAGTDFSPIIQGINDF